jgi:hypothetical protein
MSATAPSPRPSGRGRDREPARADRGVSCGALQGAGAGELRRRALQAAGARVALSDARGMGRKPPARARFFSSRRSRCRKAAAPASSRPAAGRGAISPPSASRASMSTRRCATMPKLAQAGQAGGAGGLERRLGRAPRGHPARPRAEAPVVGAKLGGSRRPPQVDRQPDRPAPRDRLRDRRSRRHRRTGRSRRPPDPLHPARPQGRATSSPSCRA